MGRTAPTSSGEVVDVPKLLGEMRELAGRIIGIVEVLESDLRGDDERPAS